MYISYDYYKAFYYVAKYGSLSQAAKLLLSNQPNLTRTIKNLESELGCPLFLRTNRGMKLTPEGERLYHHIKIACEHIEMGETELSASKNLESGSIYIAVSEVALRCLLLPILKEYRKLHPGIQIRVGNDSTPQAITELRNGTADIAFVTTPITTHPNTVVETVVRSVREVAVCAPSFKKLLNRPVSFSELEDHPIISLREGTTTRLFYSQVFANYSVPLRPAVEAVTSDQILPLVEADLGIGFVPEEFLDRGYQVEVIDLVEEIPQRDIVMIKKKGQSLSIAAKELERMVLHSFHFPKSVL